MNYYNKHYIRTDDRGVIIHGFSDAFEQPIETDICINEYGGRQFRLIPDGTENPPLRDMHGVALYKWYCRIIVERTEEERHVDIASHIPLQPTVDQQRLAELTLKQAQQDMIIANLQQTNARLLLQLAQTGGSTNV